MKVVFTISELIELGIWNKYCMCMGYDHYAVKDGRMKLDDEFILTEEELNELGVYYLLKSIAEI
ncbi:hypothetical protein ABER99_21615 [Paenibacillus glucanolyticus]|jgi:hypothetical protein|uniref:Uncharacterized protein n=1 Tax=Paenibacillus glucanolyticus TaxID=59843 RepID=A0A163GT63_9BACL|nr:hypothetical protein [Paenibacillus glucanolyticus]KZS45135.1 hypothetical protein AWU65_03900 [Paenibacillus glucanolyticus]OMF65141.1 hypothetical protein BK142_31150 [Paenibacillus glucanolyticus]